MRDESNFLGNKNRRNNIHAWDSKLPGNFNINSLKVHCDENAYIDIKLTEKEKRNGLKIEKKIVNQKIIDERKILKLYKEIKQYEKEQEELIARIIENTTDTKLKNRYNELIKEVTLEEEDMYNHPNGYIIQNEENLHISDIHVNVKCAKYYKGKPKIETCTKDQTPYKITGCVPDPKNKHNCSDKCKKEEIDKGTCISSMIDAEYGYTVGDCNSCIQGKPDCKNTLAQGEICTPTCKPGYFLERKTKCVLKDNKGVIIPGKCKLIVKKEQKPVKPSIYKSDNYTIDKYQNKRLKKMAQAHGLYDPSSLREASSLLSRGY